MPSDRTPDTPVTDWAAVIAKATQLATEARTQTARPVSDSRLRRAIFAIAATGYEPSVAITPIIRDLLSGQGVLIAGNAGTGKTFLFRALNMAMGACATRGIQTAEQIIANGLNGIQGWYEQWDGSELVIDDLGAERESVEYGARDDLLKSVIAHRAERQTGRTHVTTNLDAKAIRDRYGDRTLSRLVGMCRPHRLDGPDRRRHGLTSAPPAAIMGDGMGGMI